MAYAAKTPTYLLRFAFDSATFNLYRKRHTGGEILTGVAHSDDVAYLWYGHQSWKLDKNSNEFKTIQRMITIYTNFAKDRNPKVQIIKQEIAGDPPVIWKPLRYNPNIALNIDEHLRIIEIPEKQDLSMWDSMYANITNLLY